MVANQCESNCKCMEIQRSPENNNVIDECCQTTNKTNSTNPCCSNDPIAEAKSLLEILFFTALTEVHLENLKKQIESGEVQLTRQWI